MSNAQSGTEHRSETGRGADTMPRHGDRIEGREQLGMNSSRANGTATLRGAADPGLPGEAMWRGGSVGEALALLAVWENDREIHHAILATALRRSDPTGAAEGWPARAARWLRTSVAGVQARVRGTGRRQFAPEPGLARRCGVERVALPNACTRNSVVR